MSHRSELMLSNVIAFLFALLLIAGVPVLSWLTVRRGQIRSVPRLAIYFSAVTSEWLLAALGVVVMYATSGSWSSMGFRTLSASSFVRWAAGLTVVSLALIGILVVLERHGWWPEESDLIYRLLPETRREKLWAVLLVAPTAALCEEFLYRGYLLLQLSRWFHSASWAAGASSAAFGLAHVYQGAGGIVRATLLGALLAYPVVRLGSLCPSMAAHWVIDVAALVWIGPRFLPQTSEPEGECSHVA